MLPLENPLHNHPQVMEESQNEQWMETQVQIGAEKVAHILIVKITHGSDWTCWRLNLLGLYVLFRDIRNMLDTIFDIRQQTISDSDKRQ